MTLSQRTPRSPGRSVRALVLALAFGGAGCAAMDEVFTDPAEEKGYRLVGIYDSSALRSSEVLMAPDVRPGPYEFIWTPPAAMKKACGPAKAPDGIGIFESEAIGNRTMPVLALVIERMGDVPPLDTDRVRVALGAEVPEMFLEPAVQPRYMQVSIEGDAPARFKQQIKTQLQTYMCMEHKTGRAWQGGTLDQVRQALLLNPPDKLDKRDPADLDPSDDAGDGIELPDRKFFGGQSEPVAALLGPPSTCLRGELALGAGSPGGQGDTSLSLVPSDVWGASLARCPDGLDPGDWYIGPRAMELTLSELPKPERRKSPGEGKKAPKAPEPTVEAKEGEAAPAPLPDDLQLSSARARPRTWSHLQIKVTSTGDAPEQQLVEVSYEGRELIAGPDGSVHKGVIVPEQRLFEPAQDGQVGLIDLVSKIPYRYPTLDAQAVGLLDPNAGGVVEKRAAGAERYTVLLVPNWQLVEGIRRMAAGDTDKPRASAGEGIQDGVGWVLEHPDQIFLMVPEDPQTYNPLQPDENMKWLNIAAVLSGGDLGLRSWGYAVGMLAGRAPIALPGVAVPTWDQVVSAQRAHQHGLVLGSSAAVLLFLLAGVVRLRDLWTRVPEERVEFWPGPPPTEEKADDMAALKAGEEEKK